MYRAPGTLFVRWDRRRRGVPPLAPGRVARPQAGLPGRKEPREARQIEPVIHLFSVTSLQTDGEH